MTERSTREIEPGSFEPERHFYPRVPNARLHPLVRFFLSLGNERIAQRYCHLHPDVSVEDVRSALAYQPRHLRWAGADLFHVTTHDGVRRNVIIEVNSSPSGQKSMPLRDEEDDLGGYRILMERTFVPLLSRRGLPKGRLAVLYDKNEMEASGYAAAIAEITGEKVWLVSVRHDEDTIRCTDGVLHALTPEGWIPLRAAVRYVTQRPWTRIPPITKTALLNPVLGCLAGGRNKLLAAKAYEFKNAKLKASGLTIRVPATIWDVGLAEVPLWVERMGGLAVVKNPYSNAGQGVWTITNKRELDALMALEHRYDRFVVQALIGNSAWSSETQSGRFFHVGTLPTKKGLIYAADIRFMVGADTSGFYPVALYARRARKPLTPTLDEGSDSWAMLGTNLSVPLGDGRFTTEPDRLMLMDSRDFNQLGVGLDDLTEAYIQTILAVTAIDEMGNQLVNNKGRFRRRFFSSLNPDPALAAEIL